MEQGQGCHHKLPGATLQPASSETGHFHLHLPEVGAPPCRSQLRMGREGVTSTLPPDTSFPCWPHSESPQHSRRFTVPGRQTTEQVGTPYSSHMSIYLAIPWAPDGREGCVLHPGPGSSGIETQPYPGGSQSDEEDRGPSGHKRGHMPTTSRTALTSQNPDFVSENAVVPRRPHEHQDIRNS